MTGKITTWLSTYGDIRRRHGFPAAVQHLIHRLVNRVSYYERLNVIVLKRASLKPFVPRKAATLTTQVATRDVLEKMRSDAAWALHDWHFERFDQGDTCLLSYVDGALAGYTWVHAAGHPEFFPDLVVSVPSRYLYNYAGYTHPDFRGYGLQAFRHHAVLSQPQWQNISGILGFVHHSNFASRRGQGKSGYETIGTVRLIGSKDRFSALFSRSLRKAGIRRIFAAHGTPSIAS